MAKKQYVEKPARIDSANKRYVDTRDGAYNKDYSQQKVKDAAADHKQNKRIPGGKGTVLYDLGSADSTGRRQVKSVNTKEGFIKNSRAKLKGEIKTHNSVYGGGNTIINSPLKANAGKYTKPLNPKPVKKPFNPLLKAKVAPSKPKKK